MPLTREYRSLSEARAAIAGRLDQACVDPFSRLEWFEALHAHCFAGEDIRIYRAVENAAECWLFLLQPAPRQLFALANFYSFDWAPAFIGDPDAAARDRLMAAIARHALEGHAHVELYPVSRAAPLLLRAFRSAGWFAVERAMGGRHVLRLNGRDFAAYWAERPGALRSLIKRKGRNSPFDLSLTARMTDALWADYVDIHGRSWKEPESSLPFIRALAEREGAAGRLRLGFARLEGRAVAAQIWSIDGDTAYIHKLCHDQALDKGSPGTLLGHRMFQQAIDEDHVSVIDYGTGDNAYKADWMEERQTLVQIDCFNPRHGSSWIPAARTAISALVG